MQIYGISGSIFYKELPMNLLLLSVESPQIEKCGAKVPGDKAVSEVEVRVSRDQVLGSA